MLAGLLDFAKLLAFARILPPAPDAKRFAITQLP
jgi:hypothetical protein